jgi:hypothetical protein
MPVREFDCLRLGTPIGTPANLAKSLVVKNLLDYGEPVGPVKAGNGAGWRFALPYSIIFSSGTAAAFS